MRTEYEFEEFNRKYNLNTFFNLEIKLEKTCYFKGELIKGKLKIIPQDLVKKSLLLSPIIGNVILQELYNYKLASNGNNISEENILFKYPIDIPKFDGNKIITGMELPFEYPVPKDSYPSVIIDNSSYVRHVLIFDFPNIEAKKSVLIIIKNDQYFTEYNELYKSPAETKISTCKHKYAIFYMGEVSAVLKLFKNVYAYEESIPITIEIDCTNLSIKIENVFITIFALIKKNNKLDHNKVDLKIEKILLDKYLPLKGKNKKYHIEDIIQIPKNFNPHVIYNQLDLDKRIYSQKFKNIFLLPSCYKGLISVEYHIRMMLETDTLFSTNEYTTIQIDLYEANKNNNQNENLVNSIDEINVMTPMGNKPLHSNIIKKEEINKKEDVEKNKIIEQKNKDDNKNDNNNIINLNSDDNFNLLNNNNIEGDKIDMTEGIDAPPSVVHPENKIEEDKNKNNNNNN